MFIGFDYGTSNCAVAVMEQGSPRLLNLSGAHYLPSTLHAPHRDAIAGLLAEGLAPAQQSEYLKLRGPVVTRAQAVRRQMREEGLIGRADFGVGNTEVLTSYASGQPLLALASVYQHSPSIFLARRDSGILTVDDMRGKRIMMFSAHQDAELLATLFYQGLNEHQLIPLPTSVNIEDLIEGRVDIFNA